MHMRINKEASTYLYIEGAWASSLGLNVESRVRLTFGDDGGVKIMPDPQGLYICRSVSKVPDALQITMIADGVDVWSLYDTDYGVVDYMPDGFVRGSFVVKEIKRGDAACRVSYQNERVGDNVQAEDNEYDRLASLIHQINTEAIRVNAELFCEGGRIKAKIITIQVLG